MIKSLKILILFLLPFYALGKEVKEGNLKKPEYCYKLDFKYDGLDGIRDKVYRYIVERYGEEDDDYSELSKAIGIDMYDLNGDGIDEISVYVAEKGFCGSAGCSFFIFKQEPDISLILPHVTTYDDILILKHKHKNFHSIALNDGRNNWNIWQWSGRKYDSLSRGRL